MSHHVAVIGAGLIGRAWAIVFARAGFDVALYDISADALEKAADSIEASAADLVAAGLMADTGFTTRIRREPDLAAALAGVDYVQECGPEILEAKQALFAELEAACGAGYDPGQFDLGHSGLGFRCESRTSGAMPGRASGQPAVPDPVGRARPVAGDEHGRDRTRACAHGRCRPGAGHGASGDFRLRAQSVAGCVAQRSDASGGRRLCERGGSG